MSLKSVILASVLALAGGSLAASAVYVGVAACVGCHADSHIAGTWERSRHAQAFESLHSEHAADVVRKLKIEKAAYAAPECLQCHATASDAKPAQLAEGFDITRGVQCESCHGPGGRHTANTNAPLRDLKSKTSMSAVCRNCHSENGPICKVSGFSAENEWPKISH